MTISTILSTTHFIGDTDGDMDGRGDLGTHGMALYGDGLHLTTGIIGDAVRFGEEASMGITTSRLTSTISEEHLLTDMVLVKEYVQAQIEVEHPHLLHAILRGD